MSFTVAQEALVEFSLNIISISKDRAVNNISSIGKVELRTDRVVSKALRKQIWENFKMAEE